MGTDIHMACERRINGKWELVTENVFKNDWYNPNSDYEPFQKEFTNVPYDCRNYNLFAILADVRNGRGFAGCKIGEGFKPISEPKGYPSDMCDELKSDIDYYYDYDENDYYNRPHLSNEHSATWLTLKELLDYDWEQTSRNYGCVSEEQYKTFIMKGLDPDCWSGGVGGRNIVILQETEMVDLINGKLPRNQEKEYYTSCYFNPKTYAEHAGSFYTGTIPILKTLVPSYGTEEDVRLVFDFDS